MTPCGWNIECDSKSISAGELLRAGIGKITFDLAKGSTTHTYTGVSVSGGIGVGIGINMPVLKSNAKSILKYIGAVGFDNILSTYLKGYVGIKSISSGLYTPTGMLNWDRFRRCNVLMGKANAGYGFGGSVYFALFMDITQVVPRIDLNGTGGLMTIALAASPVTVPGVAPFIFEQCCCGAALFASTDVYLLPDAGADLTLVAPFTCR
jgi:hypothetical protein